MKIRGRVTEGSKVGRELGYPTANIAVDNELRAENGVYAAIVEHGGHRYRAMANLGVKPTVSDSGERFLELHLFGFAGDLYDEELTAELAAFIRPERKFASREELRAQIEKDKNKITEILIMNHEL